MLDYTKESEDFEHHEAALAFIEATKDGLKKDKRSEEYLKAWEDGVMDLANHLDGRI